ncbi:MAG TPA: hypothetical protein VJS37_11795, partial [Terriglobales bacterium]|nr:hypothetical protein [Terriglobales bacterium]
MSAFRTGHAHFDLVVSYAYLQTWLWMHGWPVHHMTIVKGESGGVIWTNNTPPDQFAFGKRPAEMRARLRHRKNFVSTTNKQNGCAFVRCTGWHTVHQLRFSENGHKFFRKYFTSCAIDAYS